MREEQKTKSLWQRYRAEYQKQNSRPLPTWRFYLALVVLSFALAISLLLIISGQAVAGVPILALIFTVALVVYEKRPQGNLS